MNKNKNKVTWEKALKQFDQKRIKDMREVLGIPRDAFKNSEEFNKWEEDNNFYENRWLIQPKQGYIRKLLDNFANAVSEISKMSPYIESGYFPSIEEYLFFGEVEEYTLNSSNPTSCEAVLINKNKVNYIDDGVYIRIGPHANISDIKQFLNDMNQVSLIREFQKIYKLENNISKVKNVKTENFEMNNWVYEISILPIPFLQDFAKLKGLYPHGNPPKEREILGSAIMKLLGYTVSPESFNSKSHIEKKKRKVTQKRSKKV